MDEMFYGKPFDAWLAEVDGGKRRAYRTVQLRTITEDARSFPPVSARLMAS